MRQTVEEYGGVPLESLLSFNRIQALGVTELGQLAAAVKASELLELQGYVCRRDFEKHPLGSYDAIARTLYVEGLPLTFGIDDLTRFFEDFGRVRLVQLPRHRETQEPRGFCLVEFASAEAGRRRLSCRRFPHISMGFQWFSVCFQLIARGFWLSVQRAGGGGGLTEVQRPVAQQLAPALRQQDAQGHAEVRVGEAVQRLVRLLYVDIQGASHGTCCHCSN